MRDPEKRKRSAAAATARYRAKNKDRVYADVQKFRRERRELVDAMKGAPCTDCGQSFPPICMDFDHVRGEKDRDISSLWYASVERLMGEIAKCELVCANCHRVRTQRRKQHRGWRGRSN